MDKMQIIREARMACGITQTAIANELGLHSSNYCSIEKGRVIPKNLSELQKNAVERVQPQLSNLIAFKQEELEKLKKLNKEMEKLSLVLS